MRASYLSLILLMALALGGCASQPAVAPDRGRPSDAAAFMNGNARLECALSCIGTWRSSRDHLRHFYETAQWQSLADGVLNIGLGTPLTYYYLGRAAEGLGYSAAAVRYYGLASASELNCRPTVFNNYCYGEDVKQLAKERAANLRAAVDNESATLKAAAPVAAAPAETNLTQPQVQPVQTEKQPTVVTTTAAAPRPRRARLWTDSKWKTCLNTFKGKSSSATESTVVWYDGEACTEGNANAATLADDQCVMKASRVASAKDVQVQLVCMEKGFSQFVSASETVICADNLANLTAEEQRRMQQDRRCTGFPQPGRQPVQRATTSAPTKPAETARAISMSNRAIADEGTRDGRRYASDLRRNDIKVDGTACAVGMASEDGHRQHYSQHQIEIYATAFGNACMGRKVF